MKVFRSLNEFASYSENQGTALTIGCFDAVHKGHQILIEALIKEAQLKKLSSAVMLFENHPLSLLRPEKAPPMIHSINQRIRLFSKLGIDSIILQSFDKSFSELSAEEFTSILENQIKVRFLLLGFDFHFGKNRKGNYEYLKSNAPGFEFAQLDPLHFEGKRISSSEIRSEIKLGNMDLVSEMLGQAYEVSGTVKDGEKRGKKLGFATANLELEQEISPKSGVYICESLIAEKWYPSIANYGVKPTFGGPNTAILETHIFDLDKDLYNKNLKIKLLKFIRPEKKFSDSQSLKAQVIKDINSAREYFGIQ